MLVYPQFVDFLWRTIKVTEWTDLSWNTGSYEKALEVVPLLLEVEVVQKQQKVCRRCLKSKCVCV